MDDTQSRMLPPPPPPTDDPGGSTAPSSGTAASGTAVSETVVGSNEVVRVGGMVLMTLSILGLTAIVIASLLPSKWFVEARNRRLDENQPAPYALVPAAASSVDDIISFGELGDEAELYPPEGAVFFVTVSEPPQSLLSSRVGRGDPTVRFITDEDKNGQRTPQQNTTLSLQSMQTAEQTAQYVALSYLGFDAELSPGDVVVAQISCLEVAADGSCSEMPPSAEVIEPGDKIVSVDDRPIGNLTDLVDVLSTHQPGDVVSITIERGSEDKVVEVPLVASPDDPDRTIVGFFPFDTRAVSLPFELDFNTGRIGGPSAGLAFTLALTDELSPGELTGGKRIAVTGTIDVDGEVGPIGGLVQKASAVDQMGIDTFLVPVRQGEDDIAAARDAVDGRVEIIPVSTFEEALTVLQELGGDPVEPVR